MKKLKILFLEDVFNDAELNWHEIEKKGIVFEKLLVDNRRDYINALEAFKPDIIISDYSLPQFDGMKALLLRNEIAPLTPFIIVTGSINEEVAVECMKAGANDYIIKEHMARLPFAVKESLEQHRIQIEKRAAELRLIEDEKKLQRTVEELKKLRKAIDSSGEVIFLTDRDGKFTFVNPGFTAAYGYEASEVVGRHTPRILKSGCLPDSVYNHFWDTLLSGQEVKGELKNRRKNGTIIDIEGSANQILDNDRNIIGFLGIQRDITERKSAEEALRKSEEKYRRIFENVQDLYYETSIDGTLLEISPSIEILSKGQYHSHDLEGKSLYDFFSDAKERADLLSKLQEEGSVSDFEITLKNKDNSEVTCSISSKVCLDEMGAPEKIIGSMRDISDRKQVQKELLRHRDHLEDLVNERTLQLRKAMDETRDLYENAPCGYHSLDADGKFVRINNTELKWLGYSLDELINKKGFADLLTPLSLETFKSTFPVFLRENEINDIVFELVRKDGSTFFVSVSATAIFDNEGKFLMSRSTLFDITARKQAEEELSMAKMEAEEANTAKSEFLANMSHEIRTPMNAVLGYTELLNSTLVDRIQKNYINSIITSGRILLILINDILDLSKIEAGMLDLDYDYIDTYSFFSEFERIFSLKVSEKGLKFILNISQSTPSGIYIDEARLRQIVFNLIGNAIKFTSEGNIVLNVFVENPKIVNYKGVKSKEIIDLIIEIEDSGIGISKDLQEAIFEPFIQDRNNKHYGGTGLGLTITRRLTALMNGIVYVHSEPGVGSKFTVKIPEIVYMRDFSHTMVDIQIDPSEIVFAKASVLIADDVEHNRKYLKDALKNSSLNIFEAEDGITAYILAEEIVPDLIIADILMSKMNGFQLLDKIKSNKKLKDIPVIAYSASVLKDQKELIRKSKFDGLLIKPVGVSELYLGLMNFLKYTSKRETQTTTIQPDCNLNSKISGLPELLLALENGFSTTWKTFAVKQPIGEIREFGKNLIQLGLHHNSGMITAYGEDLMRAADSFNIEAILQLIGKYGGIVENIKEMANNLEND